ncbi:MAG: ABC transporter permease [Candidatus Peribacteria bacterium]|jgi:ABC-2 type transport system permease protein|nr:ABC transporter permease [Candidatus Peribacteria bacterium]
MLIVGAFCGVIIFLVIGRFPRFGVGPFFLFLLSLLVGIGLLSLISLMIALFAFILEDSTFVRLFINKLYFIFGGLFFPLDIYPGWMQTVAEFFPFKYYLYAPAKFFTTGDVEFFVRYFPFQVGWLVVVALFVWWLYARAVKRLEVNGG